MPRFEQKKEKEVELTVEEARALRLAAHKAKDKQGSEQERREEFRVYWTQNKSNYGRGKEMEHVLWVHLKAVQMDRPEKFEDGILHFGLKKV